MKHTSINIVGITLKPNATPEFYNILPNLCSWLIRRKRKVVFRDEDKSRVLKFFKNKNTDHLEFWNTKSFHQNVQIMLSLGGDGTLIGVCRRINSKIPVLGINLGRLGFITEFNKNEYFDSLGDILNGKYEVTTKPLFHVAIMRKDKIQFKDYFFNDAVLAKNDIARMIYLRAELGAEHIYNISGDGIIISTPLGSTAYSMAAGGPIVHPEVKGLILTPICCHRMDTSDLIELRNILPRDIKDLGKVRLTILNNFDVTDWDNDGKEEVVDVKYYNIPSSVAIPQGKTIDEAIKPFLVKNQMKTYFQNNNFAKNFYDAATDTIQDAPKYKLNGNILSQEGRHGRLSIKRFDYQASRVLQYKELGIQMYPYDDNQGKFPPTYFLAN